MKLELLRKLWGAMAIYNIPEDTSFDYVDMVGFSAKRVDARTLETVLWCATYEHDDDSHGWYGCSFDRHEKVSRLAKQYPNWVFLVERRPADRSIRCIVVEDIFVALESLYRYQLLQAEPKVVGVTGSVGKTTTVSMLEDALASVGKVFRVYAKRITPLSLFELVVNHLEADTEYVVMEYAMYYRHHIPELMRLLPVHVGIFLNLGTCHIGTDGIRNVKDIYACKVKLLEGATYAITTQQVVDHAGQMPAGALIASLDKNLASSAYVTSRRGGLVQVGDVEERVRPFVDTDLSWYQLMVTMLAVKSLVGIVDFKVLLALASFVPKENRLYKVSDAPLVFFDGEVMNESRMLEMSRGNLHLLVWREGFTGDDTHSSAQAKQKYFAKHEYVYVEALRLFKSVALMDFVPESYIEFLAHEYDIPVVRLGEGEVLNYLYQNSGTVVHAGSYWRSVSGASQDQVRTMLHLS